ncbi:MAG TPA: RHS repeat-associated core domain-containing protein [Terriglobales bacterium]|nr:RHS repeat-associated core domain-containing protein [Terriglobales bacterium]
MNRAQTFFACLLLILLTAFRPAIAQVTTGTPPFGSFGGGPFDTVNLGNLNVHMAVPIMNKSGRGIPFTYALTYESSIYQIVTTNGVQMWEPVTSIGNIESYWGWQGLGPVITPYVGYSLKQSTGQCFVFPSATLSSYSITSYSNFAYHDTAGTAHSFPNSFQYISGAPANQSGGNCPANGPQPSTAQTASAFDGSGFSLTVQPPTGGNASGSLVYRDGTVVSAPFLSSPPMTSSPYAMTDANGNKISFNNGVYTDTLGTSVLTVSGTQPSPTTLTYTGPAASQHYQVNYTPLNIKTNFGCGPREYSANNVNLISTIVLPDNSQYSFSYEGTPGNSGFFTGRISQITLPTGGTIQYNYTFSGSNDGINCSDGSTMVLQRTLSPSGAWQYTRAGSGSAWTTTVTDPASNQTAINFEEFQSNFYETQRLAYQGSTGGTLLSTSINCYNGQSISNPSACFNTPITAQVTRITNFSYSPNAAGVQKETDSTYDQFGLIHEVDDYDYGSAAVGSLLRKTATSYAVLSNGIVDRPASVTIKDPSNNVKAFTAYTYDEGTPATTTGTPQHVSISGHRGNLTTVQAEASSSASLYRKYAYYDTGMLHTSTDVSTSSTTNGATTTYNTTSCGNSFVTSISEPVGGMSRSFTWDCNGGVMLSVTDANSATSSTAYSGTNYTNVFWRPYSTTDQAGTTTDYFYILNTATPPVAFQTESKYHTPFNGGNSTVDKVTTNDGFGRTTFSQTRQAPGASNYDTTATCRNNLGQVTLTTLAYSTTLASSSTPCPSTSPGTAYTYDALGRTLSANDNFTGGGTTSYSYSKNDVLQTRNSPTQSKQNEYDGLGRLKSVCEINSGTTSWPSASCGQNTSATGYLTSYTFDLPGNLTGVTQNAQAASNHQTRSYSYDMLSRLISETDPEANNTAITYSYDSLVSDTACGSITSAGNLLKRLDAAGNATCYAGYDALHRVGNVAYPSSSAPSKHFVYDAATVNGTAMSNVKTRLAEAYTCTGACSTKITDLGFSYTATGQTSDTWESTPNSAGFYHANAIYWPNGSTETLALTGLPTITYGTDGEGRTLTVSASSGQNPVTTTSYNSAGQVTSVTFGSADSDTFTYDPNTGRMTQYKYTVNGSSIVGTPGWNTNGTMASLGITDPFNSANTQSCSYSHDGMGRVASASCGTTWSQTFTYDPFGNITKSGSISWQPGYNSATNRYTLAGTSYDANGNVLNDSAHTYTWDTRGRPLTIDTIGLTYDALDRMVEQNISGTLFQIAWAPSGSKLAIFSGQTLKQGFVPLPGGATAQYHSFGLGFYRHADWLGSERLETAPDHSIQQDVAYAPFGENYSAITGGNGDLSFTGQNKDTVFLQYDFRYRQYAPKHGRWTSPDQGGLLNANASDPQTWNKYAYVGNRPLNTTDALGLFGDCPEGEDCCDPFFGCCDPFFGCGGPPCDPEFDCCDPLDPFCGGPGPGPIPLPPIGFPRPPQRIGGVWPDNETLGLPGGLNAQPLGNLGDLFGLLPNLNCGDFVQCGSLGPFGFEGEGTATIGIGVCAITPGCQEVLLGGIIFAGTFVATELAIDKIKQLKADIQFAREVQRQVEQICGHPVDSDQIHDLLHWGHYGSLKEAVDDIVGIVCPGKASGGE